MTVAKPNQALLDALSAAEREYVAANSRSQEASKVASASLPGGGTRATLSASPFPLYVDSAHGSRLTSVDGREYKDFVSDYTSGIYGHSHPVLVKAISGALQRGLQLGAHTENEARLARGLCSRFPSMDKVRFTNSGTEANMLSLAAALRFTGRSKMLVFEGAYHGSLLSFGETSAKTSLRAPFDFVVARYNDVASVDEAINGLEGDIGAIIVEPMLGAGGGIPGNPAFLQHLRDVATRIGAVLIFDEVQTSRLSVGGRQLLLGITPDMTTVGKYYGGGFAFGAFGGRAAIMDMFDTSRSGAIGHGGTFNNSPLTMVAGATALEQILTADALRDLNALGDYLRDMLNAECEKRSLKLRLGGLGSVNCIKGPSSPEAKRLTYFGLIRRGFWADQRGTCVLNLTTTKEDVDEYVKALVEVAEEVQAVNGLA